jgi:rSAM/selenodomain-associated transferase 2
MLSIIIPTLNEEGTLRDTLAPLTCCLDCEIIVVDGGSSDNTVPIAKALRVKTRESPASRALQMNKGAREAKGEILLFLHADTLLPPDFKDQVLETLGRKGVIAGAFKLAIDHPGQGARLVEKSANWRARFLQLPYGDQAIFISKENFLKHGGFTEVEFLEDLILVRRLQKHGKIATAKAWVITSGRRWKRLGLLKTTLVNQMIIIGYLLGFSIPRLKKFYRIVQKV